MQAIYPIGNVEQKFKGKGGFNGGILHRATCAGRLEKMVQTGINLKKMAGIRRQPVAQGIEVGLRKDLGIQTAINRHHGTMNARQGTGRFASKETVNPRVLQFEYLD